MRLSTRARYGTRMMVYLAEHYNEGPIQIRDIAKHQNISVKYLEQLIIPLKKANFIKSIRGAKGGYMLAISPDKIRVGDIVRTLEGHMSLTPCVDDPSSCDRITTCLTRSIWQAATAAINEKLDAIRLSDMVKQKENK